MTREGDHAGRAPLGPRGGRRERRGAARDAAWLDVFQRTRSVPRDCLEIVTVRPDVWSVVDRPYDAVELPVKWGSRYAVCPRCSRRAALPERAAEMECPACERVFPLRASQPFSDRGPFGDSLR